MMKNKQMINFALKVLKIDEIDPQKVKQAYEKLKDEKGDIKLVDEVYDYLINNGCDAKENISYDKEKFERAFSMYEILKYCNDEVSKMQSRQEFLNKVYSHPLSPDELNDGNLKKYVDEKKEELNNLKEPSSIEDTVNLWDKYRTYEIALKCYKNRKRK